MSIFMMYFCPSIFVVWRWLEKLKICSCFVTRAVMMESLMKHMCDILTV